jgi:hypothetical protein
MDEMLPKEAVQGWTMVNGIWQDLEVQELGIYHDPWLVFW